MNRFRVRSMVLLLLLLAAVPLGCRQREAGTGSAEGSSARKLTIGSKRFTESYILGEIIRQKADAAREAKAAHKQGLGSTGIVFEALKSGSIDVYPEYTGTID